MSSANNEPRELLAAKLNGETARVTWSSLMPHFASGHVISVRAPLDLIDVAVVVAKDDAATLRVWVDAGQVGPAHDDEARLWHESQAELWAVVVKPFVLVQEDDGRRAPRH